MEELREGVAAAAAVLGWTTEQVWRTPVGEVDLVLDMRARRSGKPYERELRAAEQRRHEKNRAFLKEVGIIA